MSRLWKWANWCGVLIASTTGKTIKMAIPFLFALHHRAMKRSVQREKGKTMSELCTDNRFELIEKYKAKLIEATNIETDTLGMAAIDSILFRFWQMGWLDKLDADAVPVVHGKWEVKGQDVYCSVCGAESAYNWFGASKFSNYCPNCGAKMDGERKDDG